MVFLRSALGLLLAGSAAIASPQGGYGSSSSSSSSKSSSHSTSHFTSHSSSHSTSASASVSAYPSAPAHSNGSLANAPYKDSSLPVEDRIKDLLARMTIEEKASQLQQGDITNWMNGTFRNGEWSMAEDMPTNNGSAS